MAEFVTSICNCSCMPMTQSANKLANPPAKGFKGMTEIWNLLLPGASYANAGCLAAPATVLLGQNKLLEKSKLLIYVLFLGHRLKKELKPLDQY